MTLTIHPRETWEPTDLRRDTSFTRRPPALRIGNVTRIATHYTAAIDLPDGDPGEILDGIDGIRRLLAAAHNDYLRNRTGGGYTRISDGAFFPGYPLGYSFAFDWLGSVWEINGFDYLPAATSGWNSSTLAFLMLTDRADRGSDLMWASHREMARRARDFGAARLEDRPWPHRKFREVTGVGTATACCGDPLVAQIEDGLGDMSYAEPQPMPPEGNMKDGLLRLKGWADVVRVIDNVPMPLSGYALDACIAAGVPNPYGVKSSPTADLRDPRQSPAPYHEPTKWWLEHQLGYPLSTSPNGV
jgi:hypothetical protein